MAIRDSKRLLRKIGARQRSELMCATCTPTASTSHPVEVGHGLLRLDRILEVRRVLGRVQVYPLREVGEPVLELKEAIPPAG